MEDLPSPTAVAEAMGCQEVTAGQTGVLECLLLGCCEEI